MPTPETVYYFGTCLIDLLYPKAGLAGMQLLQAAGVQVIYPQDQSCCGQPAFNSGYRAEALAVARSQLACFDREIPIVVPSASCADMMRNHWPELFAGEPDEPKANDIAQRTWELTAFLVEIIDLRLRDLGEPVRIALHHSCSARRGTGSHRHTEALLAQLTQVEVASIAHAEECCGFGGSFALKQPALSAAMTQSKCEAIENSGAQLLVSQDCGCLMNLDGMLQRREGELPVRHIAEFLLERSQ